MDTRQNFQLTPRAILLAALAVFAFLQSVYPLISFDTWWHLKAGQYMWETRAIAYHDVFTYTIYGKPWLTFEWLAQVIFYGVYKGGGIAGLILFKASLAVLILWGMVLAARRSSSVVLWMLFAAAFIIMRDALRERPQLFTYLFAVVYAAALRRSWKPGLLLLPVLQVLWANLHGVAGVIGLCLVLTYAIFDKELSTGMRVYLAAGCAAGTLLSPHTWHVYAYLYTFFAQGFRHLVSEYLPPQLILWYFPFYVLSAVIVISFALPGKRKLTDIVVVLGTLAAALAANRNIPVFLMLSAPVAAERFSGLLYCGGAALRARSFLLAGAARKALAGTLAAVFLFASFWCLRTPLDFQKLFPFRLGFGNPCMYAAEFISYCDGLGLKGNLFNDYDFGGYLIWRLWPERKVFVDGRLVEFGEPFIRAAQRYNYPEVWARLESEYNFTAAVVSNFHDYMSSLLDSRRDWILVYWDDDSLVYLKNVPGNNGLIKRFAYTVLRPGSPDYGYLLEYPRKRVLAELDRALALAPQSVKARRMKEFVEGQK